MISTDSSFLALIQVFALISTFTFVFSSGLRARPGGLSYFRQRRGLLVRSLFSVNVLVPLIAIAVIVLLRPDRSTAIGLLLLASSPVAPKILGKISKAGGNQDYAMSLYIAAATLAIIMTPATLALLSRLTGTQVGISPLVVAEEVGGSIFLPVMAGMIAGHAFPELFKRLIRPLEVLSEVTNVMAVIIILVFTYPLLLSLDARSYLAIASMIAGTLLAGYAMATGMREEKMTLALESATRNTGLAMLIASAYAPLENVLPVLIPYIITAAIIDRIYLRYRKAESGKPAVRDLNVAVKTSSGGKDDPGIKR